MNNITKLELDLLLLYYTFADEEGKVNMSAVRSWIIEKGIQENYNIILPWDQFIVTQEHVNILMDNQILPDTREIIEKAKKPKRISKNKQQKN